MADFVFDSLTDTNGTNLTSHTGETGATWTLVAGQTAGNFTIQSGLVLANKGTACYGIHRASGTPGSADYEVRGLMWNSGAGSTCEALIGPMARLSSDMQNGYYGAWVDGAGQYEIHKISGGSDGTLDTAAGTAPADNAVMRLTVKTVGGDVELALFVDDVPVVTVTDTSSPITSAGSAGFYVATLVTGANDHMGVKEISAGDITTTGPSVTPFTTTIDQGETVALTADDFTGGTVTWSSDNTGIATVNASTGVVTGVAHGSADDEGCVITATGVADAGESADMTVTVRHVDVVVHPASAIVPVSGTQQFSATVTGNVDESVTWSVTGGGSINASTGLYTAPGSATADIVVTATSNGDTDRSGTADVDVIVGELLVLPAANYGPAYEGSDFQVLLIESDHGTFQDWSTANVSEVSPGCVVASAVVSADFTGWMLVRNSDTDPVYGAREVIASRVIDNPFDRPLPPAVFGPAYAGLTTVEFQILSDDGSVYAAWDDTDVTEDVADSGVYTAAKSLAKSFQGFVEWRTEEDGVQQVYEIRALPAATGTNRAAAAAGLSALG